MYEYIASVDDLSVAPLYYAVLACYCASHQRSFGMLQSYQMRAFFFFFCFDCQGAGWRSGGRD